MEFFSGRVARRVVSTRVGSSNSPSLRVSGSGPTMSIPQVCHGRDNCAMSISPESIDLGVFLVVHPEHDWIHLRMSTVSPFQ